MVMPENAQWPGQQMANGRFGNPPDHCSPPGTDELRSPRVAAGDTRAVIFGRNEDVPKSEDGGPRGEPGRSPRDASTLSVQGRQVEELLFRARSHADALAAQAQAEAEELMSRAHAQAELLRVHAEAMRAEAEHMRAEAGALQTAVRAEVDAASSCTEVAVSEARAAAEELRSAIQLEAATARQQLEQVKAEVTSICRLWRAELDAGLADAERLRGDVRRLCVETNKLATELAMVLAGRAPDDELPADPLRVAPDDTLSPVGDGGPEESSGVLTAAAGPMQAQAPELDGNIAELLRKLWDAAYGTGSPSSETSADEPDEPPGPWGGLRSAQPLIGSGGWQAKEAAAPEVGLRAGDEPMLPAPVGRRRRFHRR